MKKLFSLLVAGTLMLCGAFCNNAEALRHYHHQGADGQEDSVLFFNENFAYDEGFAMEVNHTNTETSLLYLGNWKREPSGYISVKYDLMKVRDGNGKITQEKTVDISMKLLKKFGSIQIISPDAPDNSSGNIYNFHEYVWGNEPNLASYMLTKFFKNNEINFESVKQVSSLTGDLGRVDKERISKKNEGPEGEGAWFDVIGGPAMGTYYVESDPMAIYRREGAYLNLVLEERITPIPMEQRAAAIDLGNNRARVIMYKDRTTEYYDIFFTPDYFVVEKAFADDPEVTKELQEEIGIRQQYGPNPRVNEVRQKLRCDL